MFYSLPINNSPFFRNEIFAEYAKRIEINRLKNLSNNDYNNT